jgi:predicted helicase
MTHHRRPHQKRAVSDTVSGFKRHDRGQLISACGTGKTRSCLWVKEDLDAQRTLVMVPSLALISQYADEWRKNQAPDQQYVTLCVCSDNTVGQVDDEDEVHFTADDLKREGFAVTSDPSRIAAFAENLGSVV